MTDINGKKILVTGGTGFLGKNLLPYLTNRGATAYGFGTKFDLSSEEMAKRAFSALDGIKFDYIIHAAAVQGAADWPLKHKAEQFDVNLRIHINTFKMWHKFQPQAKMVGICSSCSYPGVKEILKESEYWDGPMHPSVDIYGFTKKTVCVGIESYKSQHKMKGTTAVLATLYGPHDHFDLEKSHVVSALIKKFVDAKNGGISKVEIWGDGSQMREIIYVEDQVRGIVAVLDYDGPLINIGSGISISIKDLAETIKKVSEYTGEIVYDTSKFVGIKKKMMDVSLAKEKYGWTTTIPLSSLESSLEKTIMYYKSSSK